MGEGYIKSRFVNWNLLGLGVDRSPFEGAKYAYHGPILFAHGRPVARLLKAPDGNFVALARNDGWITATNLNKKPNVMACLHVECIGVFSIYEGDMLDEPALHERSRWLYTAKAARLVELAQSAPDGQFVNPNRYYPNSAEYLMTQLMSAIGGYNEYRRWLKLRWKDFPPAYLKTLERIILERKSKYDSAVEVAKRERKAARAEAKRALGLG